MLSISINSQDMDGHPSTVDGCSLMRRELGEGFWWANVVMLRDIFVKLEEDLRKMCPPLYRHPLPSCSNLSDYVVGQRLARVKVPCDRKVGSRPCLSSPLFMFELRSQLWINSVSSIIDYWSSCSSPATDHFNGTFCLKVWTVGSKSDQIQQTVVHAHLTRDLIMEEDPWMVFLSNMLSPNIAL